MDDPPETSVLEWAVAYSALPGQRDLGDRHLLAPFPGGALLAVIDGLGHGPEAAHAAEAALPVLNANLGAPVDVLIRDCHDALKKTRGAAMTLVHLDTLKQSVTWAGVGNVEAVLVSPSKEGGARSQAPLLFGGIVGYRLPVLHPTTTDITADDLIVLATDGIHRNFLDSVVISAEPQRVADRILERCWKRSDDALVLVARYKGKIDD